MCAFGIVGGGKGTKWKDGSIFLTKTSISSYETFTTQKKTYIFSC
jgi:hypothetical protein